MNNNAENIFKQILLEELDYLTYAEKKNLRDSLDQDFINKELHRLDKQKKLTIFRTILLGICATISIISFVTQYVHSQNLQYFFFLFLGIIGSVACGFELGSINKRKLIYPALFTVCISLYFKCNCTGIIFLKEAG